MVSPATMKSATVGARQLAQGHKGLNPGKGTRSDLPPKRIFQFIPQHNTPGPAPASVPIPPSQGPLRATPGAGCQVNPLAAGISRKGALGKVGHAVTWLA